ncbi:MAG: glycosyltransferase [Legionellaceae bacterium]|nr:glycosyltransferase [Legionellaceae bacterium]
MTKDLVTIILPTYNCAHFLPRAIGSVLDQTYHHWELLIIDNYSTDKTSEVLQVFEDPRIKFLQVHNEGIIAKSRNLGIQEAKGRWVAFLDADDWWVKDKLEASVRALLSGYEFVYHDLVRKGPGKRLIHGRLVRTRKLVTPVFHNLLLNGNAITNSSVVVSRNLLLKIGGLSENPLLIAAEDFDCWIRVSRETEKFCRLQKAYGFYWIGAHNVNANTRSLNYLNELQRLYFPEVPSVTIKFMPLWFVLATTKAYIKENKFKKALMELSTIKFSNMSVWFFARLALLVLKGFATSSMFFGRVLWHKVF